MFTRLSGRLSGMRILKAALVCLLCCAAMVPVAEAGAPYGAQTYYGTAVVSNPNSADRLNLRALPSSSAASSGRYYNGVQVTVLEYVGMDWVKVSVGSGSGSAQGYMLARYLAFGAAGNSVRSAIPRLYVVGYSPAALRANGLSGAAALGWYNPGTPVELLGFGSYWHHVRVGGKIGFMEASSLSGAPSGGSSGGGVSVGTRAVVNNPNPADRLNLRTAASSGAASLGKYYNGVAVYVLQVVNSDWVKVRIGESGAGVAEGYMMRRYLAFASQADRVRSAIPVRRCASSAWNMRAGPNYYSREIEQTFGWNADVEVLGVRDDGWWHVRSNGNTVGSGYGRLVSGYINTRDMRLQ